MNGSHIILTLAAAQLILAMSPGPNTILVLQSAWHGRRVGLATAAGVWPVSLFWAAAGLAGLGALIRALPGAGTVLSLLCGSYLIWLGVRAIARSFEDRDAVTSPAGDRLSLHEAFKAGAVSNLTNPKTIAYFTSIFSATGAAVLTQRDQAIVMVMMPTISFSWYGVLVILVSHGAVRKALDRARNWLDRVAGVAMIGFGVGLFSKVWRQWPRGA